MYRRLQQRELARLAGISYRKLQQLEAGVIDDPKLRDLVNLALALDCEVGDLVEDRWLAYRSAERSDVAPEELARRQVELPTTAWPADWGPDQPIMDRVSKDMQEHFRSRRRDGDADA